MYANVYGFIYVHAKVYLQNEERKHPFRGFDPRRAHFKITLEAA